jgi:abortive infection bacteriophage resistance protein
MNNQSLVSFAIKLVNSNIEIYENSKLIYCSKLNDIIDRMKESNTNKSLDIFIFSEICEFNDDYSTNEFEFTKEFLLFAKELTFG